MELPLFPLNSVLFPGMPIRLHIFEERYKQMINDCIQEQKPFGVVLIEDGEEAFAPSTKPYTVGTTAYIQQVQRLAQGRMNILAIGRERFRINAFDRSRPYLVGDVDMLPFQGTSRALLAQGGTTLYDLIKRYLEGLQKAGKIEFDAEQLPTDPLPVAYLGAVLLQTENEAKQHLLEIDNTRQFIYQLIKLYQQELMLLNILLNPPDIEEEEDNPFSLN